MCVRSFCVYVGVIVHVCVYVCVCVCVWCVCPYVFVCVCVIQYIANSTASSIVEDMLAACWRQEEILWRYL